MFTRCIWCPCCESRGGWLGFVAFGLCGLHLEFLFPPSLFPLHGLVSWWHHCDRLVTRLHCYLQKAFSQASSADTLKLSHLSSPTGFLIKTSVLLVMRLYHLPASVNSCCVVAIPSSCFLAVKGLNASPAGF